LKYGKDGVRRMAGLNATKQWMGGKVFASFAFIDF
jgi:hypothetical protein